MKNISQYWFLQEYLWITDNSILKNLITTIITILNQNIVSLNLLNIMLEHVYFI